MSKSMDLKRGVDHQGLAAFLTKRWQGKTRHDNWPANVSSWGLCLSELRKFYSLNQLCDTLTATLYETERPGTYFVTASDTSDAYIRLRTSDGKDELVNVYRGFGQWVGDGGWLEITQ